MGQLRLTCFGTFQATLNDAPLTAFQTDKVRALLVYLVVERQAQQRNALAQLLWPGYTVESANTSLRQTLRRLRQLLGDDDADPAAMPWLIITRQTVQINPAAILEIDTLTFTELLAACATHSHGELVTCQPCLARLRRAVELYQGDFLSGFTIADNDPFEEWRRITQEQFHLQTLDALTHLATAAEKAGDDEAALQYAQRQLALEPWLEAAHRGVMRVLARRGQRTAALAQYNRCCQLLAEELGAKPDAQTAALAAQIERGEFDKKTRRQDEPPPKGIPGDGGEGETLAVHPPSPFVPHLPLAPHHNLPTILTPFMGRAREVAEICERLRQPEARLLTLVGAGGMGKTRLALAVAQQLLDASTPAADDQPYPDGIFFVPLASLTTVAAIAPAMADALGLEPQGEPQQVVRHFLQRRRLLLMLDNFEHLLDGAELVAMLLQEAPGVQILVTSRERLKLRGEQIYPVSGLDYGHAVPLAPDGATMPESAALHFFVHCAQQGQAGFTLQAADRAAVKQICQLVQGMPLALELAAAWVALLPLTEIAQEIARNADFLRADWPDVPERQRSMRAVFTWSWQLLAEHDQRLLCQLALFTDSFTRPAAEQIAGATVHTLTSLLNKSLMQVAPIGQETNGERRYELHPVVRQFAAEQLAASGAEAAVAMRYSTFYLTWLATCEAALLGSAVTATVAAIQGELDHVRQAWRWASRHGQWAVLDRSAYVLSEFMAIVGYAAEAEQLFLLAAEEYTRQQAAATASALPADPQTLSKLWALVALARSRQGKATAVEAAQLAITLGADSDGVEAQLIGYYVCGIAAVYQGTFPAAQRAYAKMAQLFRQGQQASAKLLVQDLNWRYYLGLFDYANYQGHHTEAQGYSAAGLQAAHSLGSLRGQLTLRMSLLDRYLEQGALRHAQQELDTLLPIAQQMRWRWGEAAVGYCRSFVYSFCGDYRPALHAAHSALKLVQEIGVTDLEFLIRLHLAYLYTLLGDHRRAQVLLPLPRAEEQQRAPLHIRYSLLITEVITRWRAGQLADAYAAATQAWTVANRFNNRMAQACALIYQGHLQTELAAWTAATEDYRAALQIFTTLNAPALGVEAQAGLAYLALRQGHIAHAQQAVDAILPLLADQPYVITTPAFTYLHCYQVLAAKGDPRATTLLQQGYDLLQQRAAALDDELRPYFLESFPSHRALIAAYATWQAQKNNVTADKPTADKPAADKPAADKPTADALNKVAYPVIQQASLGDTPLVSRMPIYDWSEMPAVDFFTGRATELAQVMGWLAPVDNAPPAQLVSILGLGGMGKTTLAAAVTKAVAPHFRVVIWRSLLNAPPLGELLGNWLQILARQRLTTLPTALDEQLRLLLDHLRQERCLLVLDNVESIFGSAETPGRAGSTRPGYEGYDQLFQRIASSDHQSCLLLTSREQPYALLRLGRQAQEGVPTGSGRIRVLGVTGLAQQAGQALLQTNGLHTSPQEAAQLIDNYSGNPLALQIVAATIADFFGGDIAAFRQEAGVLFDGMRVVLDQQFARLSPLERDILVWLAIEREEVTVAALRSNLVQPVTTHAFLEALQALQNRSLLETRATGLTLQNVIIEYATAYLVEQVCAEICEFRKAMPDPEGATSFLNRFALLKAQAKEYVRQSQLRLILRPLAERLLTQVGKAQLPITLQRRLDNLRQTAPGVPGYAAGNLLNLLLFLEVDLHEYDFSGLCIWQAHLRNANAVGLRLAGAQLRDSTFTDNFTTIQTMAFHPTGELLAAGGTGGAIYLWQTLNWQRVGILYGHRNAVRSLAFAPSSALPDRLSILASGGADGQIYLWTLQNGQAQPSYTLKRAGYIRALAFSPDGTLLVSGSDDQTVCLWQATTGELRQQFTGHRGRIYGVAFAMALSEGAHQGKRLVISGGEDTHVYLWDADSGEQVAVLAAHQYPIRALACAPAIAETAPQGAGAWLATADEAGIIYLWDLHTLRPCRHWQEDQTVIRALSFNADGTRLASAGDNGLVRIWEPTQGRLVQTILGHRAVATATFSPRSPFLLATSGYDRTISLWNAANGQALHFLHGYRNKVYVAHFQPPFGNLLATGHSDGVVRLWQIDEGEPRLQRQLIGHPSNVFTLAFSPDGTQLASGSNDTMIRLWKSATGEHLRTLAGHTSDLYSVAFSPDGRLLVSTSADQTIRLWDIDSGVEVRRFATHGCTSWSAAFHPNGEWVATGDFDHQVRLWEVATGRLLATWSGHRWEIEKVAFSPDGAWLASGSHDGTIRLWSVQARTGGGTTQRILHGHTAPLWSVAFSPDGSQLVSCGEDMTVRLWDLWEPTDQDTPCQIFTGHTEEVFTAHFHPNGQLLASASGDGSVCLWKTQSGALHHQLYVPGPYAGMQITGVTGISEAQKAALRALGAVEG